MLTRLISVGLSAIGTAALMVFGSQPANADGPCRTEVIGGVFHQVCEIADDQTVSESTGQSDPGSEPELGDSASSDGGDESVTQGDDSGFISYPTSIGARCISPPYPLAPADLAIVQGTRSPGSVPMVCISGVDGGPPFYFWAIPAVIPPAPVDLSGLSRRARADMALPEFSLQFGPDAKRLAVNMQTDFTAVPNGSMDPTSAASDQGITVTVTGHLVSMSWSPGEPVTCTPGDRKAACAGGRVGPVECASVACQYTYHWVSSTTRTGGAPVWTVAAEATWEFSYSTSGTAPGGTTGLATDTWTETLPAGTGSVSMGEWSTRGGFER